MNQHTPNPKHDLEEAAQGHDHFKAPGADLQLEQAREQATASGWLPPDVVYDWPSIDAHQRIANRRQDLYDVMQKLEASVARASGQDDWEAVVEQALLHLMTALERHVGEIEGSEGLFAEVIDRAPHLAAEVDALRGEHSDLVTACRAALDIMSRPGRVDPQELRRKTIGILGRLALHRQRGSELLFDTYNMDLAAAD